MFSNLLMNDDEAKAEEETEEELDVRKRISQKTFVL